MRVAIERHRWAFRAAGWPLYLELSLALARSFPDDEFFLVSDQPFRMPPGGSQPQARRRPAQCHGAALVAVGLAREMSRLARTCARSGFRGALYSARPSVLTLHDLSRG